VEEGQIVITIFTDHHQLTIHYQDNGIGMSPGTAKKIFDPFFTTKRGQGGSGLGMHIVYNLVTQKLKGQIECVSNPGEGAEFTITIPLES